MEFEEEIMEEDDDFFGWLADAQHEDMILGLGMYENEKGDKNEKNNNEGQSS